ncbi:MAG: hypothetical protein GC200_05110 [Tepidisphaera sp.]|nr:hypothetical protein [Tepidisphaera sp.]
MAFTLEEIAAFGVPGSISKREYPPGTLVSEAKLYFQKIVAILTEWKNTVQHIKASNKYTEEGKKHMLGEAFNRVMPDLMRMRDFLAKGAATVDKKRSELVVEKAEPDSALTVYIWENLPEDGLLLADVARQAIERGDQRVFDAIRTMPFITCPVDRDTIIKWEADWAEKRSPQQAQELRDMREAVKVATEALDRAERLVRSDAGIGEPDELQRLSREGGV